MTGVTGNNDDKYMYEFCTRRCTWKECPKDATCWDAHSKVMCRRVPKRIWAIGGLFNYIPEHCPQYKWKKKCNAGSNCYLAHGWLEVIFHPLLYKTKLCKSTHVNGVCRLYGIYCAKAHKRSEMRNLAKIYGKDWKLHYDLSKRTVVQNFVGGLEMKAGIHTHDIRDLRMNGDLRVSPNCNKELKVGGSNDVSDHICGSNSLHSSIQSLTISESSDSLLNQTPIQSPNYLNPFRSEYTVEQKSKEYPEVQITDYTDLYNINRGQSKQSSDEFGVNKEIQALFKYQPATRISPRPAYTAKIFSKDCPSIWGMDKENNINEQGESKVQLLSTNWSLFGLTRQEASCRTKFCKKSGNRREQEDVGGAI